MLFHLVSRREIGGIHHMKLNAEMTKLSRFAKLEDTNEDKLPPLRLQKLAEIFIRSGDYKTARRMITEAIQAFPAMENLVQIRLVVDILNLLNLKKERDPSSWYFMLHLLPSDDEATIRGQFQLLTFILDPLKNNFPGTELALKLANSAMNLLCSREKTAQFDPRTNTNDQNRGNDVSIERFSESLGDRSRKSSELQIISKGSTSKRVRDSDGGGDGDLPLMRSKKINTSNASGSKDTSKFEIHPTLEIIPVDQRKGKEVCQILENMAVDQHKGNEVRQTLMDVKALHAKNLTTQIMTAVPQVPHYRPLANYGNEIRRGMMVGLYFAFLNISNKIRNLKPESFWSELDGLKKQLSELERMGYNVEKLREHMNTLRGIMERDRVPKEEVAELETEARAQESKVRDAEAKVSALSTHICELRSEVEKSKGQITSTQRLITNWKSKIEKIREQIMKEKERFNNLESEFAAVAQSLW
ncbi:uncharacterized protein LOC143861088 [Tasmannia lanceolata]|uniref:uncharacterized protein LOC143861088 n=1 Tax=Tasmannia lanceolata TaxID=3420 RepID=UPI0040633101